MKDPSQAFGMTKVRFPTVRGIAAIKRIIDPPIHVGVWSNQSEACQGALNGGFMRKRSYLLAVVALFVVSSWGICSAVAVPDVTGKWVGGAQGVMGTEFIDFSMVLDITEQDGVRFLGTMDFGETQQFPINGVIDLKGKELRITGSVSSFEAKLSGASKLRGSGSKLKSDTMAYATVIFTLTKK